MANAAQVCGRKCFWLALAFAIVLPVGRCGGDVYAIPRIERMQLTNDGSLLWIQRGIEDQGCYDNNSPIGMWSGPCQRNAYKVKKKERSRDS